MSFCVHTLCILFLVCFVRLLAIGRRFTSLAFFCSTEAVPESNKTQIVN